MDEPGQSETAESHPDWFRRPTRREHAIGAALFSGFALFFLALFLLYRNWWFRWVILILAVASGWKGLGHLTRLVQRKSGD